MDWRRCLRPRLEKELVSELVVSQRLEQRREQVLVSELAVSQRLEQVLVSVGPEAAQKHLLG
jgi:hypothetical protein